MGGKKQGGKGIFLCCIGQMLFLLILTEDIVIMQKYQFKAFIEDIFFIFSLSHIFRFCLLISEPRQVMIIFPQCW